MKTIKSNTMDERMLIGTTKKAIEDKILKFLKRLNTIESTWIVTNDIWIPAERSEKTRPGLHIAHNPNIGYDWKNKGNAYITEPLPEVISNIESIEGKRKSAYYIQTAEHILVEIESGGSIICIVIANVMWGDDRDKKLPGILFETTFKQLIKRSDTWVDIPMNELMKLKSGNVLQIEKDGFVLMRLVRSLFKLRGRSERVNVDIRYSASYCIEALTGGEFISAVAGGISFVLFVDYGFMQCEHRYLPVPYPIDANNVGNVSLADLGLFDEGDMEDYDEYVD